MKIALGVPHLVGHVFEAEDRCHVATRTENCNGRRTVLPEAINSRQNILAIDSKLRRCDVVQIQIGVLVNGGRVRHRAANPERGRTPARPGSGESSAALLD